MNETISQYWSRATQYWQRTNKTQRIMFLSIIVLTVLTIAVLTYNFSRTEYALAYTDLSSTDAAAIKTYLESTGIPYEFSADGTSIGVPAKLVTSVKIDAAANNLIQNGSQGFGIFKDNLSSFGMTDNEFGILSVDARAGEIQKLINSYEGVVRSQVLLTIPQESVFINSGEPEEALVSAVITFKPGFRPTQPMVDGIYNLIKTAVAKLPLENITVSDQNGEVLMPSSQMSGGMAGASTFVEQQLRIKKLYEADIQKNIKSFLSTIYDSRRVAVSVVATLNFDQVNSQSRTFTPVNQEEGTGIIRSEQTEERSASSTGGGAPGGIAGTGESDVPNYPGSSSNNGNSSSEELIATRNYEINELTQSIISSPYIVKDLTIFAGIEPPDPDDPNSLPQAEVDEIKRILANIVSTSLANNSGQTFTADEVAGKVSVLAQSFRGVSTPSVGNENALWYYGLGGAALALLAAAGGYAILSRRRKDRMAAMEAAEDIEEPVRMEFPTIDIDQAGGDHQIRKQLEGLAKKKPEEFVNLLRTWLVEE